MSGTGLTCSAAGRGRRAGGFTLLEVLVTLVILAFGLLALVNLQIKLHMTEAESYQRAQAVVLAQDMINRIMVNQVNAAGYVTGTWVGEGGQPCDGFPATTQNDICAWTNLLLGTSVQQGGDAVGAMEGTRGCVQQVQARDTTPGVCRPGIYRVTVAWQGLYEGTVPADNCAAGADYGGAGYRRAISTLTSLGTPGCLPP